MSNKRSMTDWLDAARKSTVFAAISPITASDIYPKAEHSLLATTTTMTDLRLVLKFVRLDGNKIPAGSERDDALRFKAQARSWLMLHRPSTKGAVRKVETWWQALLPIASQHVISLLAELNLLDKNEKRLYSGDADHIGTLSMTVHDAAKLKMNSIVQSLVADNPLAPSDHEDLEVLIYSKGQLNIVGEPTDPNKLNQLQTYVANVKRSLVRFRELLNHTIMYVSTVLCHKETLEHMRNLHSAHVRSNANLTEGESPRIFTADTLYDYLKEKCSVDNEDLIRLYKTNLEKLYRKNKVTPLQWLRQYEPLVHELNNLKGTALSKTDEQKLWKKSWGRNLTLNETTLLFNLKDIYNFPANKWKRIARFRDGEFDTPIMEEFLTLTQQEFKPVFEPDAGVLKYNYEHYKNKQFDPKLLVYTTTKQPDHKQAGSKSKSKTGSQPKSTRNKRVDKSKQRSASRISRHAKLLQGGALPPHLQCTNPYCVQRNIARNHTYATCRNKDKQVFTPADTATSAQRNSTRTHRPLSNHGALQKSSRNTHDKQQKGKGRNSHNSRYPCRICGGTHPYGQCPVLNSRKANTSSVHTRIATAPAAQQRLRQTFYTQDLQHLAKTVISGYDLPNVCHNCLNPSCEGYCNPTQEQKDNVNYVMTALKDDPALAQAIRDASRGTDQADVDSGRAIMAPLNVESFFAATDWGHEDDDDEQQPASDIFTDNQEADNIFGNEDTNIDMFESQDWDHEDAEGIHGSSELTPRQADSIDGHSTTSSEENGDPLECGDVERETSSYFTVGISSEDDPNIYALDSHFGIEVESQAYASLADTNRRSLICECTAKIKLANGKTVIADIKLDNCNTRMLAGEKFLHSKKSCYEYGIPPVRMITASKEPTSWKRDAGIIEYYDDNGILCTSLAYVDYDNPDLILMDMSTRLDAQVDEHYHATTSRDKGIQPLRRKTKQPYHFRDFTPEGVDPWRHPELRVPKESIVSQVFKKAKRIQRAFMGKARNKSKKAKRSARAQLGKLLLTSSTEEGPE